MDYDIIGVGTALIDLTPIPSCRDGKKSYECNPGGSIANFLAAAALQGSRCAFMGKVGDDVFGRSLKNALEEKGVDCRYMVFDARHNTPCSVVSLDENGERSFLFYRDCTADSMFSEQDIDYTLLKNTRLLHVTSFVFAGDISYESILKCLRFSKEHGVTISFDVNWRPYIWRDRIQMGMERIRSVIKYADIVKVSDEELEVFTGCGVHDVRSGATMLLAMGPKLVIVTHGSGGSSFFTDTSEGHADAYQVRAVDTTGAGDCCLAVLLHELLRMNEFIYDFNDDQLTRALKYANLAASYCVQHRGGISSMPGCDDMRQLERMNQLDL